MTRKVPTITDLILAAAYRIGPRGEAFTAEDLIVAAWKADRDYFGLQGFADKYPDSNRVLTKIMGSGSVLRAKGWLAKVGSKKYRLTEVGRQAAEALCNGAASDTARGVRLAKLSRGHVAALRRMLESSAIAKYAEGQDLTFSDVCAFWNISPRSTAHQLARQKALADDAVGLALQAAGPEANVSLPGSDAEVEREELERLVALSRVIETQFRPELAIIRGRADERRV